MSISLIGKDCLYLAYNKQVDLFNKGVIWDKVSKGKGSDIALKADWESEEVIINFLKENNFPGIIYSEEHGIIKLCNNPHYLIVLDGFDGSSGKARGGTMLAISNCLNPKYKDFIFAGITDFLTNQIVYSIKGKNTFLERFYEQGYAIRKLEKFPELSFSKKIKMHFDDPKYWGNYEEGITSKLDEVAKIVRNNFTNKLENKVKPSGLISSGAMCVDLVLSKVDAIAGVSAKGVFEPPAEYLINQLGGTIVDYSGKDIGENYWLKDRELHEKNPVPLLRASSPKLAREIIEYLQNEKNIS